MKNDICDQTIDLNLYGRYPAPGFGITRFVYTLGAESENILREQLYSVTIAINSSYTVYLNRLVSLGRKEEKTEIMANEKVLTLFGKFLESRESDPILREQFYVLNDLWIIYLHVREFLGSRHLKYWAYEYTVNICFWGIAFLDLPGILFLLMVIVGVFLAFLSAWTSEYVVNCLNFEEKNSIEFNTLRFDWS